MSSENLELEKIHSKQDKIREYEDILLSNVDIDPKKKEKMEEKINDLKDKLDDKTFEIINNENIIPSDEEMEREDEEMNELMEDNKIKDLTKELVNEVEGFSLENSSLFNMISITQEDMFILILLILALFFRKEIISFMKKKM
mgnify:CR=1 FL=1